MFFNVYCGERGIRTPGASQHGGFQDRCNRPLYHLSIVIIECAFYFFLKALQRYNLFLILQIKYLFFLN